jgi:hypothetical protein
MPRNYLIYFEDILNAIEKIEKTPESILEEVLDFMIYLKTKKMDILEISLMSESSLKKDWLTFEEDNAWADL